MSKVQYGLILVVTLVGGMIGGAVSIRLFPPHTLQAKTVQAKQFEVVRKGKILAKLNLEGLSLSSEGNVAVLSAGGPSLGLVNLGRQTRIVLDTPAPSLTLYNENEKRRAEMSLWPKGEPHLRFYDKTGQIMWAVPEEETYAERDNQQGSHATEESPAAQTIAPDLRQKIPHPACPTCYTYPGRYEVFEDVPGTDVVISRDIPNPAPGFPAGVQKDKSGESMWYVGTQPMMGSTDEESVSRELPIPLIQVKRIQARHMREIMSIPGVHGFGIGAKSFVVSLLPDKQEARGQIPKTLEGVPVEVEIRGMAVLN